MISLDVRLDIKQVTKSLNRLQRKQVPFATALALTKTVQDIKRAEDKQLETKLHKPTRFTRGAIGFKGAKKNNLVAYVFVKDIQAKYLRYQISGGRRITAGKGTGVPTRNRKLNAFGNIPGRRKGLVKGKKQFVATINGISGVWERTGNKKKRGVKLLIAFEKVVKYEKRFPFYKIAEGVARARFPRNFNTALQRAIDTAR